VCAFVAVCCACAFSFLFGSLNNLIHSRFNQAAGSTTWNALQAAKATTARAMKDEIDAKSAAATIVQRGKKTRQAKFEQATQARENAETAEHALQDAHDASLTSATG
jgi:hypothetical protein